MGLPQDRRLPTGEVGENTLQPFPFGLALLGGMIVESIQVCSQNCSSKGRIFPTA